MISDAQQLLTDCLKACTTGLDPLQAAAPLNPVAGSAYVWAGDPWVAEPEDGSFCQFGEVTLVVDVVASTAELTQSQAWLADRVAEIWLGCAAGVDVGSDRIRPTRTDRPALLQLPGGATLLVARTTFTAFALEA